MGESNQEMFARLAAEEAAQSPPSPPKPPRKITKTDLQSMGVPKLLWRAHDKAIPESAKTPVSRIQERLEEFLRMGLALFFWGAAGVGKSSIASVLAKAAYLKCFDVLWLSAAEYREALRRNERYSDEFSMRQRCLDVICLVIDDLTDFDLEDKFYGRPEFLHLARRRAENRKVTIITTRLNPEEDLSDFLGGVTSIVPVPVIGENYRERRQDALCDELFGGDDDA